MSIKNNGNALKTSQFLTIEYRVSKIVSLRHREKDNSQAVLRGSAARWRLMPRTHCAFLHCEPSVRREPFSVFECSSVRKLCSSGKLGNLRKVCLPVLRWSFQSSLVSWSSYQWLITKYTSYYLILTFVYMKYAVIELRWKIRVIIYKQKWLRWEYVALSSFSLWPGMRSSADHSFTVNCREYRDQSRM